MAMFTRDIHQYSGGNSLTAEYLQRIKDLEEKNCDLIKRLSARNVGEEMLRERMTQLVMQTMGSAKTEDIMDCAKRLIAYVETGQ